MSIKTNELRLGNFVFDDENIPMQIAKLETEKYTDWNSGNTVNAILEKDGQYYESDIMNYIPFTEEWIIKFGLSKQNGYPYKYLNGFLKIRNGVFFFKYHDLEVELPFVHNFQNLNFTLTGVELAVS